MPLHHDGNSRNLGPMHLRVDFLGNGNTGRWATRGAMVEDRKALASAVATQSFTTRASETTTKAASHEFLVTLSKVA